MTYFVVQVRRLLQRWYTVSHLHLTFTCLLKCLTVSWANVFTLGLAVHVIWFLGLQQVNVYERERISSTLIWKLMSCNMQCNDAHKFLFVTLFVSQLFHCIPILHLQLQTQQWKCWGMFCNSNLFGMNRRQEQLYLTWSCPLKLGWFEPSVEKTPSQLTSCQSHHSNQFSF